LFLVGTSNRSPAHPPFWLDCGVKSWLAIKQILGKNGADQCRVEAQCWFICQTSKELERQYVYLSDQSKVGETMVVTVRPTKSWRVSMFVGQTNKELERQYVYLSDQSKVGETMIVWLSDQQRVGETVCLSVRPA
jgi:hypothetical protein